MEKKQLTESERMQNDLEPIGRFNQNPLDQKMELDDLENYKAHYDAQFWIYEEQKFGTWKESQAFYTEQAKKRGVLRAMQTLQSPEGKWLRKSMVE
jgi:hypothetical protein|tara:strand:+ start:2287 stop:2574 length:288 start_codon:yes stop_codon:yes gene_type:complete